VGTRVGYTGGSKPHPTYHSLGDHTETLQVDYDPNLVSYEELLEVFWNNHNPTRPVWSQQYKSAVFYHNEAQKEAILQTKAKRGKVHTEVIVASTFYLAEDYHQKYLLQQTPELMKEFQAMYPHHADIVGSMAAARINGYVGGHGTVELLRAELDQYGLSEAGTKQLEMIVQRFRRN
jgi:peptide-methionine (S)-S-oxide reductase